MYNSDLNHVCFVVGSIWISLFLIKTLFSLVNYIRRKVSKPNYLKKYGYNSYCLIT